ncbi:MAG: hypothetical protein QM674_19185 [Burkholderiaceae bacterium]
MIKSTLSCSMTLSPLLICAAMHTPSSMAQTNQGNRQMNNGEKMATMLMAWKKLGGNCGVMADNIIRSINGGNAQAGFQRFIQVEPMCSALVRKNGGY